MSIGGWAVNIHLQWSDLIALSTSVDAVRDGLDGLDIAAALDGAEAAMPGSTSAGRVAAAAAAINHCRMALGAQYGAVGHGTRGMTASHQGSDEAVAGSASVLSKEAAASAAQWASRKGLD
ncbi:hypothetical protein [Actinomyces bowdenii]|uniref:ESX-1 secretion-associated protein n=1 Tax=Actinomyces bowdenii TaxID=131109 RepID=A0A3P1V2D3_9ACTO|nr:hypothetical protein [Actinomyces bowdenii]RRD28251.1 hypothetical protein EII10_09290 [Actinomyces bowdenii]